MNILDILFNIHGKEKIKHIAVQSSNGQLPEAFNTFIGHDCSITGELTGLVYRATMIVSLDRPELKWSI